MAEYSHAFPDRTAIMKSALFRSASAFLMSFMPLLALAADPQEIHAETQATSDNSTRVATTALVRNVAGSLSILAYHGVDPTGATDSTSGISRAVTDACLSHRPLFVPAGSYKATSVSFGCDDLTVFGAGIGLTKFIPTSATGDFMTIGTPGVQTSRIFVRDFSIMPANGLRTGGYNLKVVDVNTVKVSSIYTYYGYNCFGIDNTVGANRTYAVYFENFYASGCSAAQLIIGESSTSTHHPSDLYISNGQLNGGTNTAIIYSVGGLAMRGVGGVGASSNALMLSPHSTQSIDAVRIDNFFADTPGGIACYVGGAGNISEVTFDNVWCASSAGTSNVNIRNSNANGIHFRGGEITNAANAGAEIFQGTNIDFEGVSVCYNSQASTGAKHGIYFGPSVGAHSVRNSRIGDCGKFKLAGLINKQGYGIFEDGNSSPSYITDNDLTGNYTGALSDGSTGNVIRWNNAPSSVANTSANSKKTYSSQPYACAASYDGNIALTHKYTSCVCRNGSGWVSANDGFTACSW